jgi:hypothetical protein
LITILLITQLELLTFLMQMMLLLVPVPHVAGNATLLRQIMHTHELQLIKILVKFFIQLELVQKVCYSCHSSYCSHYLHVMCKKHAVVP